MAQFYIWSDYGLDLERRDLTLVPDTPSHDLSFCEVSFNLLKQF